MPIKPIEIERQQNRLAAARGEIPADVLLTGGQIVDVYSGCVQNHDIAIYDGIIVGFDICSARETIDLGGKYLAPGLIESHIHVESSKLTPQRFCEVVAARGTTTVIADPHEIANVKGIEGIRFMLNDAAFAPVDVFFMLPSCVPATHMETSGANLSAGDLRRLLEEPTVLGIGEMMNFPAAYLGDEAVMRKIFLSEGSRVVDGHSPGLTGRNLSAYRVAGPSTDHECTTEKEAREKLAKGMTVMIREGSTARNLDALLPLVDRNTERRMTFASDDRRAGDLLDQGHLDHILRMAVDKGLDPMIALRMVTLNPAEVYRLQDRGGIRPGATADLVLFEDLKDFEALYVWKNGELIAKNGRYLCDIEESDYGDSMESMSVPTLGRDVFRVGAKLASVNAIEIVPNQIVTNSAKAELPAIDGCLQPDVERDILKIAVIERHSGRGRLAVGFVKGLGIKWGALGSTVAHDSHNIIAAGCDDESMLTAVAALVDAGGGQVVTEGEKTLAMLPLPIGGLMSDRPATLVAADEHKIISAAHKLGTTLTDPFMTLSFLALPVIPELKITDRGLVDVNRFELIDLFA